MSRVLDQLVRLASAIRETDATQQTILSSLRRRIALVLQWHDDTPDNTVIVTKPGGDEPLMTFGDIREIHAALHDILCPDGSIT